MTKLGTTIRARLRQLGKTQVWLADELGVSNNAVSKWIGTGKISRENSIAAARILGMTVEELLGAEPAMHVVPADTAADAMLQRAAEMIETYRLASSEDRERIDLVIDEVRNRIATVDQAKPRAS